MLNFFLSVILLFFSSVNFLNARENRVARIKHLKDTLLQVPDSLKFEIIEDIADELYYLGRLSESAETYKEARIFEEKSQNPSKRRIANCYSNEGYCYYEIGHYNNAIFFYNKALTLFTELEDRREIAIQNNNIGVAWYNLGSYKNSIEYYQKALEIDKLRNDINGVGISYSVIGNVFSEWKKYDQALIFFRKSIEIAKELGDEGQMSLRFGKIGQTFTHINKLDSALFYFEKSLPHIKKSEIKDELASRLTQVGNVYFKLGDYSTADNYYNEAFLLLDKIEQLKTKAILYSNYGRNCIKRNNAETGISYLLKSIDLCEEVKYIQTAQNSYKYLSDYYYSIGNYKLAFDYNVRFNQLKDSSFTENNQKKLAEFQTLFETQQKEATIKDLETENQFRESEIKRKNIVNLLITMILLVIGAALIFVFIAFRKVRKQKVLLDKQKNELELLNDSLNKMFAIISHDLRNLISGFKGSGELLTFYLENEDAGKMQKLSYNISENANRLEVLLNNLLNWAISQGGLYNPKTEFLNVKQLVDDLIALNSNSAVEKNIVIENNMDKNIAVLADSDNFSFIIRNLLSNAIKFTDNGTITFDAEKKGEITSIKITDSGTGISPEKISSLFLLKKDKKSIGTAGEKGTGLGLKLVLDFVKMNRGQIKVESELNKGTTFWIELPNS